MQRPQGISHRTAKKRLAPNEGNGVNEQGSGSSKRIRLDEHVLTNDVPKPIESRSGVSFSQTASKPEFTENEENRLQFYDRLSVSIKVSSARLEEYRGMIQGNLSLVELEQISCEISHGMGSLRELHGEFRQHWRLDSQCVEYHQALAHTSEAMEFLLTESTRRLADARRGSARVISVGWSQLCLSPLQMQVTY